MPGRSCRVGSGIPCQAPPHTSPSPHPNTPSQVEVPPFPPGLRPPSLCFPAVTAPCRLSGGDCQPPGLSYVWQALPPQPSRHACCSNTLEVKAQDPELKTFPATRGGGCQPPQSRLRDSDSIFSAYFSSPHPPRPLGPASRGAGPPFLRFWLRPFQAGWSAGLCRLLGWDLPPQTQRLGGEHHAVPWAPELQAAAAEREPLPGALPAGGESQSGGAQWAETR